MIPGRSLDDPGSQQDRVHVTTFPFPCSTNDRVFSHAASHPIPCSGTSGGVSRNTYAIMCWPDHARSSYNYLDWSVLLKRDFFSKKSKSRSWAIANNYKTSQDLGLPLLHLACWLGIEGLAWHLASKRRCALRCLGPIARKNGRGETALFYAVRGGWQELVKLLLELAANTNVKNHEGDTPIVDAIAGGDRAMVQLLLKNGAKIYSRRGYNLLRHLQREEGIAMIKLLIEYSVNINGEDNGISILAYAIDIGDVVLTRELLKYGARTNGKGFFNMTALWRAIISGHESVVQLLIDYGCNVNEEYENYGSALNVAATRGDPAIVRLLLQNGAKINTNEPNGYTALRHAIDGGFEEVARLLIDHGANVSEKYNNGRRSALEKAAVSGHSAIVGLLLEKGAKIDARGTYGRTALWWAIHSEFEETVQLLIDHGADVNETYDNGRSALEVAAVSGHIPIMMLLLRKQDAARRSIACRKALDSTIDHDYREAVEELLEWGANSIVLTNKALELFEAARDED